MINPSFTDGLLLPPDWKNEYSIFFEPANSGSFSVRESFNCLKNFFITTNSNKILNVNGAVLESSNNSKLSRLVQKNEIISCAS